MRQMIFVALVAMTLWHARSVDAVEIRGIERIVYGPTWADLFRNPMGLAIDAERGILAVGDTGNHRVVLFDGMGRSRGALSWESNDGVTDSGEPKCVGMDRRGRLFVLDGITHEIEVLSSAGSRLGYMQPQLDSEILRTSHPQALAVAPSGRCYVLYGGERCGYVVIEPSGRTSRTIGFEANRSGLLQGPSALAINAEETRLAILDPLATNQVKIFAPDGTLLESFGPHGDGEGTFALASYVTWGPDDTLWIIDTMRHSISVFAADTRFMGRVLGFGRDPGQVSYPSACGFLSAERFVVLERAGSRFQIIELEPWTSEMSDLGSGLGLSDSGKSGVFELDSGGR